MLPGVGLRTGYRFAAGLRVDASLGLTPARARGQDLVVTAAGLRGVARGVAVIAVAAAASISLVGCAPYRTLPTEPVSAPVEEPVVVADPRLALSDTVLATAVDASQPGCSAAVAVRGEVAWAGASGLANLSTGEKLTTQSRFDIASVSKQFTATAILMLQRQGLLSIGDPVGTYVAGLPAWGKTVTLEQLMHHTSHVPDYWKRLDATGVAFTDTVTHDEIVRAIASVRTLEPGEGYLYSNANYVLLAEVVQRVSGEALPQYLEAHVFGALGLEMVVSPALVAPDVALSYNDANEIDVSGWLAYGPSEIFTTPSELARWGDQYRESDVVGAEFATGAVEIADGRRYAAGIGIEVDGSLKHDGRWGGHITRFTVSPDRETTIVVACNGHLGNRSGLSNGLWWVWKSST